MPKNIEEKMVISRLAKKPVDIPAGVEVSLNGKTLTVKGPKGTLERDINEKVLVEISDGKVMVKPNLEIMKRISEAKNFRAMTGTFYSHINNMVTGVTKGFEKELKIVGVGYRASLKGTTLNMQLGYAHDVDVVPPEGISFEVPAPTKIMVKGIDKEKVGQVAANVRKWREPIAYGGKGIRYVNEVVLTKVGKKV